MDFCNLSKEFWKIYLSEPEPETAEKALEWFAPQCVVIGTGTHEFYLNRDEFLRVLADEVQERKNMEFQFDDIWCRQIELGSDACLVYGKIHIWWESEDKSVYIDMDSRFTFLYHKINGEWKIVHIHQSMPNREQSDGEYYPKTLAESVIKFKSIAEEMMELAEKDALTGLENFRTFSSRWDQRVEPGWLFVLDIDHFKKVNDTYGHVMGNKVLIKMSEIIRSTVREHDLVCRMGGDEFLIFCRGIKDKVEATKFAHRLTQRIRKGGKDKPYWTTVSIGAACAPLNEQLEIVLENADKALYSVKRKARGDFSVT
ncbi:MAG: diguanylate cyclase [Clostridiales bacterium]|nr:diguanylate cyclase [Clostridiales bacterium]